MASSANNLDLQDRQDSYIYIRRISMKYRPSPLGE